MNKKEDDPSVMTLEVCGEEKKVGYKLSHGWEKNREGERDPNHAE